MTTTTEIKAISRISKKTGHTIEIGAEIAVGGVWYCAWDNGYKMDSRAGYKSNDPKYRAAGFCGAVGSYAVLIGEDVAIDAAYAQLQEIYHNSPEALRSRRDSLSINLSSLLDAEHAAYTAKIEHISEHGFTPKSNRDFSAEIAAAKQALADFDAAHPEIIAAIVAEKEESSRRNMWN